MSERIEVQRQTQGRGVRSGGVRHLLTHAPRLLAALLAGCLVALVMVNWNRWVGGRAAQWTDDATAVADLTPLSAQVAGHISAVLMPIAQWA
jgi:multidrug resistance efflux pump